MSLTWTTWFDSTVVAHDGAPPVDFGANVFQDWKKLRFGG